MKNRVVLALECVVRNIEPESQWEKAVEELKRMSDFEKSIVWIELSNTAKEMHSEAERMITLSQYKLVFKRALKEIDETQQPIFITGDDKNSCCDEMKKKLDKIVITLHAIHSKVYNHDIKVETDSESEVDIERDDTAYSKPPRSTNNNPIRTVQPNDSVQTQINTVRQDRFVVELKDMIAKREQSDRQIDKRIEELSIKQEQISDSAKERLTVEIKGLLELQQQHESETKKRVDEISNAQEKNFNAYTRLLEQTMSIIREIESTQGLLNNLIAQNNESITEMKTEMKEMQEDIAYIKEETREMNQSIQSLIPDLIALVSTQHPQTTEAFTQNTTEPSFDAYKQSSNAPLADASTQSNEAENKPRTDTPDKSTLSENSDTKPAGESAPSDNSDRKPESTPSDHGDSESSSGRSAGGSENSRARLSENNSNKSDDKKKNKPTTHARGRGKDKEQRVHVINQKKESKSPTRPAWDPTPARPGEEFKRLNIPAYEPYENEKKEHDRRKNK